MKTRVRVLHEFTDEQDGTLDTYGMAEAIIKLERDIEILHQNMTKIMQENLDMASLLTEVWEWNPEDSLDPVVEAIDKFLNER